MWSKNPDRAYSPFRKAFSAGMTACQAYHEDVLDKMTKGIEPYAKASAKQIDAQMFRLKTMFKEDWSSADTTKISVNNYSNMSDAELNAKLEALLQKPALKDALGPDLRLVKDE